MSTTALLAVQGLIGVVVALWSRAVWGHSWRTVLVATLLFNALPIATVPGYASPLFLGDALVPLALVALLVQGFPRPLWVLGIAFVALLGWPVIATTVAAGSGTGTIASLEGLYRRVGFVAFFALGLSLRFLPKVTVRGLLDTSSLLFAGMAWVALIQYFGGVDISGTEHTLQGGGVPTIFESREAQRGFLGLNRGAVGVWAAVLGTYLGGRLMLTPRDQITDSARLSLALALAGTLLAVLFSGSRTGMIALGVGWTAVLVLVLRERRLRTWLRLTVIGGVVIGAGVLVAYPAADLLLSRFVMDVSDVTEVRSASSRWETQLEIITLVSMDLRTATFGRGVGSTEFRQLVPTGLSHAHSEPLQQMWESGLPGVLFYIGFLGMVWIRVKRLGSDLNGPLAALVQATLVAGSIAGLAVGFIAITSPRLATFGYAMLFVYGRACRSNVAVVRHTSAKFATDHFNPKP